VTTGHGISHKMKNYRTGTIQ